MPRRRLVSMVLAASLALAGLTQAASATSSPGRVPPGVLIPKNNHALLPLHGGTVFSLNWSGYAVTGVGITAVTSTFVVPSAGLVPPGFAATWTGIGGYNTTDLIQAGTGEDSLPSLPLIGPQYFAWYELLPGAEVPLTNCVGDASCTVTPGERISVGISLTSGSSWRIAMTDAGHWSWSRNVTYRSSESSAEWILEAPSIAGLQTIVAPVGAASFGPTSNYTARGVTRTIAQGSPTEIILSPGLVNEATPSVLGTGGQSFRDCTYTQICAGP